MAKSLPLLCFLPKPMAFSTTTKAAFYLSLFPSKRSTLLNKPIFLLYQNLFSTTSTRCPLQYEMIINRPVQPQRLQSRPQPARGTRPDSESDSESDSTQNPDAEPGLGSWVDQKLSQDDMDKSKRKYYRKRRKRMYGSDSDEENKKNEGGFVELKPEVVEFHRLHKREEELYFYDAFAYPWEKDKHYKMVYQLEKKYFPDQCLDKAFLDPKDSNNVNQSGKPKKTKIGVKRGEQEIDHSGVGGGEEDKRLVFFDEEEKGWDGPYGTVVLVNKPKGWTSFTVCGKLRRLVKVKKVGHAGTLDPMATGLLIVCVGKATKLVERYQGMVKGYSGVFRLGEATSTWDADSPVIQREPWEHIKDADIKKAVASFRGEIWQVPPMFSAIKVGGERMYEKARKGESIELAPRKISIFQFDIERSLEDRQNLIFRVTCSKGTYIRSLCADFGKALGSCAHLIALRRDSIGEYSAEDAWEFKELEEAITKNYF
ncbi:hypothetical protein OIU84_024865 [Salix udensis]|uniref:tRNA pseudouridine(55) synthase n=1 Tax=Salix udensis TaxID=889485 RepID=A0AAD6PB47_9ROSI|nr:hypothetical protein OIU84_024865 [Salix udensis]